MTLEGKGKIYEHVKGRVVIYIPAAVHKDSAFPFKMGDSVRVQVKGKQIVITKST